MSENEEEVEIKIEYFESFDTDPLCENSEIPTCVTNDAVTPDFRNENINQLDSNIVNTSLENHELGVNDENEYPLEPENEETWYKSVNNLGRYLCKFCENSYSTIQTIRHHVKNKHLEEYSHMKSAGKDKLRRTKLKCHICKKRFKNTNILQEHLQTHSFSEIQKSCLVCHATFDNETELSTHMLNKHESSMRKLHYCLTCGYSTSKLSHFKQHEKTHTQNSQIKCSFCEYTTYHPPNLKIHERTHTNDKPYTCSFNGCEYRCAAKSGLTSHMLKHEKKKNMIYCDKCSYSTVYKQSLKKHMDSHRRNSVRTRF
ncbi:hypothetical protein PYW07_010746 [Mythimna separata]|uniref:C2H2-type domain-containing protein n=1 Tax=Mythimna separata TaxID=271217 RepID=A0AAD7Y7N0_MYTSE|nr:hypothetical protein PYW07_010746 [Mythimna separata]